MDEHRSMKRMGLDSLLCVLVGFVLCRLYAGVVALVKSGSLAERGPMSMITKIESIARHRNGVCGNPFHVVTFTAKCDGTRRFVATVFDEPGSCAVLDRGLLNKGTVEFGVNSWRGDHFEGELRPAITAWEDAQNATFEAEHFNRLHGEDDGA